MTQIPSFMTIFVNMGKTQSKNSEVVIAQSGANNAEATANLQYKVEVFSIITILLVCGIVVILLLLACKRFGKQAKKSLVKDVVSRMEKAQPQSVQPTYHNNM